MEAPSINQVVNFALAASVQQHQAVLRPHQQVHSCKHTNLLFPGNTHSDSVPSCCPLTPESRTEDLRVEALLVLSDLGRVAVRSDVGRVHVDHGDLPGLVEPRLLLLLFQELVGKQRCGTTNEPKRHGFS